VKRTIRIDYDVNHKLQGLSSKERSTFNSLLNRALRRYVEWDVFAENFGLVTVHQQMWKALLSQLTDKEARELGRQIGAQSMMDFVTFYFHKFDLDSVLLAFRLLGTEYMRNFQFVDFGAGDGVRTVVLRHSLGPAASGFYSESLRVICHQLQVGVEIDETDEQIVARITSTSPQGPETGRRVETLPIEKTTARVTFSSTTIE
jgi:predicted transcriptional regulator